VNLGYEHHLGDRWDVRAGLTYDQAPEPEEYRTLVGGQVVDTWKFSMGAGRRWDRASLDFGYTVSYAPQVDGYVPGARYGLLYHELYLGVVWGH
jgi:long-subunit fatty acid transport protein